MEFKFRYMEQIVGLFLVLTVVIFIVALVLVGRGQNWFKAKYTYYLMLPQGYGLKAGSPVKMLQSEIGKVVGTGMDKESRMIVVTLQVLQESVDMIQEDSEASIDSEGVIGGAYISITPGSDESKPLLNGSIIKTLPKKTMGDYMKELEIEEKIKTVTNIINDLSEITNQLKNPHSGILSALNNVDAISGKIKRGEGTVGKVLMSDALYQDIRKRIEEIAAIIANFKTSAEDVNVMTADGKNLTADAKAITADAKAMTSEVKDDLPKALNEINEGLKQIRNMLAELEKASRDVPEISRKAKEGVTGAVEVIDTIKENPFLRMGAPAPSQPLKTRSIELQQRGE